MLGISAFVTAMITRICVLPNAWMTDVSWSYIRTRVMEYCCISAAAVAALGMLSPLRPNTAPIEVASVQCTYIQIRSSRYNKCWIP